MPFKNEYNEHIASKLKDILQKKVDHENLYTDNLEGGSGFAQATHLDLGFGPSALGATSTSKPATIPVEDMLRNLPSMKASNDEDLEGGKKKAKAKAKTTVKKKGKGLSAGGLSAGGLSAGGLSAGKKPRKKTMKGGIFMIS
jgi:hypothetical protein